jgi:ABC-type dipeptide/oligopeptide/nickel transport system permease component
MAFVLVTAVVFLVVNLVVDVIYAYLDPRVTLGADN